MEEKQVKKLVEQTAITLYEQSHRGKITLMGWMKWDELGWKKVIPLALKDGEE